jgi:hypothetical protein
MMIKELAGGLEEMVKKMARKRGRLQRKRTERK